MIVLSVSKAIVFNAEGKILLLRRSASDDRRPNEWDIPGGHVDDGEHSAEAAAREAYEEAGITVELNSLVLVYAMTEAFDEDRSVTWLFYRAEVAAPEVTLSEEHSEYAWVTMSEALNMITYHRQNRALKFVAEEGLLTAEAM